MTSDEQQPKKIQAMFARIAPRYDLLNNLLSLRMAAGWRRRLAREMVAAPDGVYLDVCCGTADQALALLEAGAGSVVGCDFTQQMLSMAAAKVRGKRVSLLCGDALGLPFADGAFDGATVTFGIRNTSDRTKGLSEMVRVVRGGGRVGVLEFFLPSGAILRALYLLYFRRLLPLVGRLISGGGAYAYLPRSVLAFPPPAEFAKEMASAGLEDVTITSMCGGAVCAMVGIKRLGR